MGRLRGTPPVATRQRQPVPLAMNALITLQQSAVGEFPLVLLLVMKFRQGVKLVSIEVVQGELIWP